MMLLLNFQYFPFFGLNSKEMVSFYGPRELKSVNLEAVIPVPTFTCHATSAPMRPI
jgi:hypothetical protein